MSLEFERFIEDVGLVKIEVIIRDNSSITMERALEIVKARVDTTANLPDYEGVDVKAAISDFRTGNIYEVFSSKWMEKYNQTSWWNLQLDNVSIQELLNRAEPEVPKFEGLKGVSDRVLINSEDGVFVVNFSNPNEDEYQVFTNINGDVRGVDDRINKIDHSSFAIELLDLSSFDNATISDPPAYNALITPVEVSYVVIIE